MQLGKESTPASPLRVGAVQMESQAGDKEANFAKIEAFVKQAAQQGVQVLVFPECCIWSGIPESLNLKNEALRVPEKIGLSRSRLRSLKI